MGFSLGWLATRNIDPQILYEALQLRPTGIRNPALSSAAMAGALPSGWDLLLMNRTERLVTVAFLADVAKGGEAVGCFVEEHVMYSAAVGWRAGAKVWSVVHDSEKGTMHLDVAGDVPGPFAAIRMRCEAAQRSEDAREPEVDHLFDISVDLADAVTGFRHDRANMGLDLEVLEAASRAWWRRLLGSS